jgi:PHP family Zn ribbon phosphoesterase
MNWQIKELENRSLISNSDAHSLPKMGREATVFVPKGESLDGVITYKDITDAIKQAPEGRLKIGYTIEFYPEEGKYHYTGHRNCNFVQDPKQTREDGNICPVCHRPLTVGVMHRVEELAKVSKFPDEVSKLNPNGVKWMIDPSRKHPPFVKLVPLNEIIAESLHSTVFSQKVKDLYDELCVKFGSELNVLLKTPVHDLEKEAGPRVAEGVGKVRSGNIVILPGFDGQYGIVKIWDDKKTSEKQAETKDQLGIDF